jgi:hypothetical protein
MLKANAGQFTDFDMVHLAMHFGVGGQAMTNRLVALRKLSRDKSDANWTVHRRKFSQLAAMLGYDVEDPHGFWTRPVVLPARYRYLAMKAYEDDEISLAKLAELLREPYHEVRSKMEAAVGVLGAVDG